MKKILFIWGELKSTFWFFPILIVLLSVGLAIGAIYTDSQIEFRPDGFWKFIFTGSTESARSILSTISGAMIGVAGTVFSITLVVLSLASSQFGSRLLRNFMHERINQIVLGAYISTYVYCLLVLNSIRETEGTLFVPNFSVLIAILAAIANIILLIIFIHHIAVGIQSDKVISEIYETLSRNLRDLYPEDMGEELEENNVPDIESIKAQYSSQQSIMSHQTGYLQYINSDVLFKIACEYDSLIMVHCRPGNYLVERIEVFSIYSKEKLKEEELQKFRSAFIIGNARTPQQDTGYSIQQMVEIAVRALSSGINDPYTAMACIDYLTSTICYLARVKFPSKYRWDEKDNVRVVADTITYEGVLDAAFNQIRQFSVSSPSVAIRLMESLTTINKFSKADTQKKAIQKHAEMVLRLAIDSFKEKNDLEDMKKRFEIFDSGN